MRRKCSASHSPGVGDRHKVCFRHLSENDFKADAGRDIISKIILVSKISCFLFCEIWISDSTLHDFMICPHHRCQQDSLIFRFFTEMSVPLHISLHHLLLRQGQLISPSIPFIPVSHVSCLPWFRCLIPEKSILISMRCPQNHLRVFFFCPFLQDSDCLLHIFPQRIVLCSRLSAMG